MHRMNAVFAMFFTVVTMFLSIQPAHSQKAGSKNISYDDYAAILRAYVKDNGMVHYRGLKENKYKLISFTESMANTQKSDYDLWTKQEKIAFRINSYNSLTLKAIIDHYPIKASFLSSIRYPKNSIRQISGVWDKIKFTVLGNKVTLDDIEHKILRTEFSEPRIHMALVCAAMGCPPLRNEPYSGEKLDTQLDDQARAFLAKPQNFRIDKEKKRVYLSSIFKWFGKDFTSKYDTDEAFRGHSQEERAVLNFIGTYLDQPDRRFLREGIYEISYIDYDWSLNEQ